jgi:hypothetical protein
MNPLSNAEKTPEKGEESPVEQQDSEPEDVCLERDELYNSLSSFYRNQLADPSGSSGSYGDLTFSSPS